MKAQEINVQDTPKFDQHNNIRRYLCEIASGITDDALKEISSIEEWQSKYPGRRTQLIEMLGLQGRDLDESRTPPKFTITGEIQDEGFRIIKLFYESAPNILVPANLYVPDDMSDPGPAILYVAGHAHNQKSKYQTHARSFAQNGFVCLIIETIQRGEIEGEHLGAESLGWFHWYSKGYHPGGVEVLNGMRAIDLLCQLPEVDKSRIGVTGISGGGSQSWYLPAIDPRIQAAAAVAGAGSLEGQICQRTIDDHCDCMMPINTYGIDFSDIGALIAPRPFMLAQTTGDGYYSIEAVRKLYEKTKKIYSLYDAENNLRMVEAPGGHSYGENEEFRSTILSFFLSELAHKGELNKSLINPDLNQKWTEEELKVFLDGVPPQDQTKEIQNLFVDLAEAPPIEKLSQVNAYRDGVKDFLLKRTFRAFPEIPVPLQIRTEFSATDFGEYGTEQFSFVTEKGWRLRLTMQRRQSPDVAAAVILVLRNANEERWASNSLVSGSDKSINIAYFEARGIGESGWDPSLQWHIRRAAAWTGRTIASMRVYDVMRCIHALRQISGIDPNNICLAAQGEMVAVAAYAALLDGNVKALIMKDPPATQDAASNPDGKGEAIEMLNCLQVTDLPQVAGMMFPNEIVHIGELPTNYEWTRKLYEKLNHGDAFKEVKNLSNWRPGQKH